MILLIRNEKKKKKIRISDNASTGKYSRKVIKINFQIKHSFISLERGFHRKGKRVEFERRGGEVNFIKRRQKLAGTNEFIVFNICSLFWSIDIGYVNTFARNCLISLVKSLVFL